MLNPISHPDWLKLPEKQKALYGPNIWETRKNVNFHWTRHKCPVLEDSYEEFELEWMSLGYQTRQVHYLIKPLSADVETVLEKANIHAYQVRDFYKSGLDPYILRAKNSFCFGYDEAFNQLNPKVQSLQSENQRLQQRIAELEAVNAKYKDSLKEILVKTAVYGPFDIKDICKNAL